MKNEYVHVLLEKCRGSKFGLKTRMSAREAFEQTEKELRRLNSSIRKSIVNLDHLGNTVFLTLGENATGAQVKTYVNNHFTAGYYSFLDLRIRMEHEKCFDYIGIKRYGYLIGTLLFQIKDFATEIGRRIEPDYFFFDGGSANVEDSKWHYFGTLQLVYNCTKLEAFADRGENEGRFSSDFEDIVHVLNNRVSIWDEIKQCSGALKNYLKVQFIELLSQKYIDEWISVNLEHNEQNRVRFILGKMAAIAEI